MAYGLLPEISDGVPCISYVKKLCYIHLFFATFSFLIANPSRNKEEDKKYALT